MNEIPASSSVDPSFLASPSADFINVFYQFSHFRLDLDRREFTFDRNFGAMLKNPSLSRLSLDDFLVMLSQSDKQHFNLALATVKNDLAQNFRVQIRINRSDNSILPVECVGRFTEDSPASGKRVLAGLFRDVSELLKEQPDLSQSERWFMEVLEESPHALYRVDYRQNRFDYASKGFADALGMTREEVLSIPYTEFVSFFHPGDFKTIEASIAQELEKHKGGKFTTYVEFRFRMKNGEYVWLNDTFSVVPGPDGQYAYQVGFGTVIEDRKKLEEQLQKANEQLEEKVRLRTEELRGANESLKALMVQRRELERKLLEISERERRFIGRELHDGLCQQVVGVMCMFEAVRHRLVSHSSDQEKEIRMMRDYLQDAVHQIRTLSRGLCPMALEPRAVGAAMATLAAQTTVLYKIDCQFDGSNEISVEDTDAALHLFRIAQEAIQNAIRHGGARKIRIALKINTPDLELIIENDGRPIDKIRQATGTKPSHEAGSGLGLKLIDYRVDLLGGSWQIANKAADAGVYLSIKAPVAGGTMQ
ncbi:MAG: PAS domain-containing protein [Candidatus Riflebacteria bacterium]|nr:PAS domain-containing protein [Candidatus Riflebacteria bacterium]